MILLDTNVLSEPLKPQPSAAVLGWLNAQDPMDLHVSTVTVAEVFAGVEVMQKGSRRTGLHRLIERDLLPLFEGRVLSFDEDAAREFAKIFALSKTKGRPVKFDDGDLEALAAKRDRCGQAADSPADHEDAAALHRRRLRRMVSDIQFAPQQAVRS